MAMNKIERIDKEIAKTREKITEYLLCRCAHNPYACIAHTVKKRVKLPPLRVLLWRRFQKKLVYGYIVAEHKLKENL